MIPAWVPHEGVLQGAGDGAAVSPARTERLQAAAAAARASPVLAPAHEDTRWKQRPASQLQGADGTRRGIRAAGRELPRARAATVPCAQEPGHRRLLSSAHSLPASTLPEHPNPKPLFTSSSKACRLQNARSSLNKPINANAAAEKPRVLTQS